MANPTYSHYVLGLRDVKITNAAGSTQEDLDAAQELTVTVTINEAVLEGDDVEKASISRITGATGRVQGGSISSSALGLILGVTPSTTSTTPNRVTTTTIKGSSRPPYFKIYGMAYDDEGGALQVIINKAKLTGGLEYSLSTGDNFVTPGFDFRALEDASGDIVTFKQLETAAALPST